MKIAENQPKTSPKSLQDGPKTPQDPPRQAQDDPGRPQDDPKTAPRRPQDGSKTAPRPPKTPKIPVTPQEDPQDLPKDTPGPSQDPQRSSPESPKGSLKPLPTYPPKTLETRRLTTQVLPLGLAGFAKRLQFCEVLGAALGVLVASRWGS